MNPRFRRSEHTAVAHFDGDFVRRLELFVAQVIGSRERREGARLGHGAGEGAEFVGYRPYRAGEDLRRLDWSLYARLDRPYVRVTRPEVGGRWLVWLDASASMALGRPTKFQRACEVAAVIACVGVKLGARVKIEVSNRRDAPFEFARLAELPRLLGWLGSLEARGREGLATLVRPVAREAALFALGDGLDVAPEALAGLAGPARRVAAAWILAEDELVPEVRGAVRWVEPETGAAVELDVDAPTRTRYLAALEQRLDAWRREFGAVGGLLAVDSSRAPFEDTARVVLQGAW